MPNPTSWQVRHYLRYLFLVVPICLLASLGACYVILGLGMAVLFKISEMAAVEAPPLVFVGQIFSAAFTFALFLVAPVLIFARGWIKFSDYVQSDLRLKDLEAAYQHKVEDANRQLGINQPSQEIAIRKK